MRYGRWGGVRWGGVRWGGGRGLEEDKWETLKDIRR